MSFIMDGLLHFTSSCGRFFLAPSHHVSLGGGKPPTAWHTASSCLLADTNEGFARIDSDVGLTAKKDITMRVQQEGNGPIDWRVENGIDDELVQKD